jgi:hypothetical protein
MVIAFAVVFVSLIRQKPTSLPNGDGPGGLLTSIFPMPTILTAFEGITRFGTDTETTPKITTRTTSSTAPMMIFRLIALTQTPD